MPSRRPHRASPGRPRVPQRKPSHAAGSSQVNETARLHVKPFEGGRFAFLPPLCARDRQDDLDEVRTMIAAGELEIARDELLYLVGDCRGFLEAHNLLAELALEEGDVSLARGHFGFAYEVGLDSLPPGFRGRLPAGKAYNTAFFAAGRGLARCLIARGKVAEGRQVLEQLAKYDSQDEQVRTLLKELDEGEAK